MHFVDFGGSDAAYALDFRSDNRLLAAGCSNGQLAWAQVGTRRFPNPIKFTTSFAGQSACVTAARFAGADRVMLAGVQTYDGGQNIALARFETTINPLSPTAAPTATPTATPPDSVTATPTVTSTPPPTTTATPPGGSPRRLLYLPLIAYHP
jgi:hypothetical protein